MCLRPVYIVPKMHIALAFPLLGIKSIPLTLKNENTDKVFGFLKKWDLLGKLSRNRLGSGHVYLICY